MELWCGPTVPRLVWLYVPYGRWIGSPVGRTGRGGKQSCGREDGPVSSSSPQTVSYISFSYFVAKANWCVWLVRQYFRLELIPYRNICREDRHV